MEIPITNLETKKISGAIEGTFAYNHEKAHLEFNESNWGLNVQWLGQMCETYTLWLIVLAFFVDIFKWFALATALSMAFTFIYEEVWCNYRAKEMLK